MFLETPGWTEGSHCKIVAEDELKTATASPEIFRCCDSFSPRAEHNKTYQELPQGGLLSECSFYMSWISNGASVSVSCSLGPSVYFLKGKKSPPEVTASSLAGNINKINPCPEQSVLQG